MIAIGGELKKGRWHAEYERNMLSFQGRAPRLTKSWVSCQQEMSWNKV
jgi:hypothetical protein